MNTATIEMSRSANAKNEYQGDWLRVLCVCSAGLLRSPTVAWVLSNEPYSCNTRAAGATPEYALIPVDQVLLDWAECVVFVNLDVYLRVRGSGLRMPDRVYVLKVPDKYGYRDPELVRAIQSGLDAVGFPRRGTHA